MENENENKGYNDLFGEDEKKETKKRENKFSEKNYLNVKLAKNEDSREMQIRIVPDPVTKKLWTAKIHTHSLKVNKKIAEKGFKSYICGNDDALKENDPRGCAICNYQKELFAKANALPTENELKIKEKDKMSDLEFDEFIGKMKKDLFKRAYSLNPKVTYILRVIDRAHEDEGIKFWRFNEYDNGKGIMDVLKNIYNTRNEESKSEGDGPYNVFSVDDGKDLKLTLTKGENTDDRTEITIIDYGKQKPLSKNPEQLQAWLNDPKDWRDMYTVKPYDFVEIVVDGGVPVFNKEKQCWVTMEENTKANEQAVAEAKREVKEEIKKEPVKEVDDNDLPF